MGKYNTYLQSVVGIDSQIELETKQNNNEKMENIISGAPAPVSTFRSLENLWKNFSIFLKTYKFCRKLCSFGVTFISILWTHKITNNHDRKLVDGRGETNGTKRKRLKQTTNIRNEFFLFPISCSIICATCSYLVLGLKI